MGVSGVGLLAAGVPAAGVWAFLVLLLAIVQLPPILILGPIIVYVFSVADPLTATLFAIWSVLVSVSDVVLKPLLLGRRCAPPATMSSPRGNPAAARARKRSGPSW